MNADSPSNTDQRRWTDYLWLPTEQTDAETAHLDGANRAALRFFVAHLPVFVAIGWLNETGALTARCSRRCSWRTAATSPSSTP